MSDDDDYQVKKAFPVDGLLKSKVTLRPGEAPADAIEYLRYVAHEASLCKDVVVAVIDEKKLNKQTVVYTSGCEKKEETSGDNAPVNQPVSREWKIYQVSDFSNVRTQLAKMKASSSMTSIKVRRKELPQKGDHRSWCQYCLGYEIASKRYDFPEQIEKIIEARPPLARVICSMDQPLIEKLLEYHNGWMEVCPFTVQQGMWIYSLMAGLELPLTPDVCSVLRALARTCADVRDKMEGIPDEKLVTTLNLIICLVSKYFRQLDLEDL